MSSSRSLVTPTSSPLLEKALREKLQRRNETGGSLGELEPLAIRLGLMQNTLKPLLHAPQMLIFAADHGLAVDGITDLQARATHNTVHMLLSNQLPMTVFAVSNWVSQSNVFIRLQPPLQFPLHPPGFPSFATEQLEQAIIC